MMHGRVTSNLYKNITGIVTETDDNPGFVHLHSEELDVHISIPRESVQMLCPRTKKPLIHHSSSSSSKTTSTPLPPPSKPTTSSDQMDMNKIELFLVHARRTDLNKLIHACDNTLVEMHGNMSDQSKQIYNSIEIQKVDEQIENMNLEMGDSILDAMVGFIRLATLTRQGRKGDVLSPTAKQDEDDHQKELNNYHHNPFVTQWVVTCTNLIRKMLHRCTLATMFQEVKQAIDAHHHHDTNICVLLYDLNQQGLVLCLVNQHHRSVSNQIEL